MILSGRFLELAEQGRLRLIIRPTRAKPLRSEESFPVQERKQQGLDDQKFPKRQRRLDPETGLSNESDEPRETRETRCWLRVANVVEKHVHEATDQEAKLAGFFGGRWELWRWWKDEYDESPADLVRGALRVFDTPARFYYVEPDEDRYPAAGTSIPSDPRGYTHSAGSGLPGAGAAVPEEFQRRLSTGEMRSGAERAFEETTERQRELQRSEMRSRLGKLREACARTVHRDDVETRDVLARIDTEIDELRARLAEADRRRSS